MKKQILLFVFLLSSLFSYSQTNQGDKLVGGTVSFGTQFTPNNENQLFLNFNPNYGKFINDNIAVGAGVNLNYQKISNNSNLTSLGLLPFVRYYIGNSDVLQFYGEVKGGFLYQRNNNPGGATNNNGFQINVGPGVAFFLSENVSFDFIVNYGYVRLNEFIIDKRLSFNFGFQVYLLGNN